ncbi:MAG: amidohydrolase family protein [Halieaceae bacterium]|nr:amidohydrolase family protein [Halieaceae bacterium]
MQTPSPLLLAAVGATALLYAAVAAPQVEPGEEIISGVLSLGIAPPAVSPPRGDESAGPYEKLVISGVNLIDGSGAPTRGPVDIVIEGDRIVAIRGAGTASLRPGAVDYGEGTRVIDAHGQYALPGFIDAHVHLGTPTHAEGGALTDPEYVTKLWLAHGVTTVRDVGSIMGLSWTMEHRDRAARGEIAAPRIQAYALFPETTASVGEARAWVEAVHARGADGVKFLGAAPEVVEAAIGEARRLGMGTAQHHSQVSVKRLNALDTARMGLDSMEHWYGLPEAMFEGRTVQDYPYDYNYSNEQDRFGQAGRLWLQAAPPGSKTWNDTIDELIALDFTIDPTFTIYEANRDLMRARRAVWHDEYTMPYMLRAFSANPHAHGSYFFDWTTGDEIAWKANYRRWMTFINDFKNRGGRVTAGSDSGFIWKIYGFGFIRELELLQEAGFHPLEVIESATLNGAELMGIAEETGSIEVGKKADVLIVNENPMANFKVLYGTGHEFLNPETGAMDTTEGIVYTIRDGIVFEVDALLEDVRELVAARKAQEQLQ